MSSKNVYQFSPAQPVETEQEPQKQSKISYARDFLLSLSELDICKKLPSGFDTSILSEFEDASHGIPERQRIPGSFSLQNFKRGEYGSSPPTRGDSSNYSRGSHGKWDSRSSGSNERDGDSQSDWDSDSGRRNVNHSRHSLQNSEHDGLLGSGAFPRPSGYTAGVSAPKVRGNGHYQINEPYHPPRPYKAVPHVRRETTDLINDETFGSAECSSQDRAEEERKRRASFELMRKEQHKAFQEKQKPISDNRKEKCGPDITAFLKDSEDDKKLWNKSNVSEDSIVPLVSENDSARCSFPTQNPASRPLVPPGFTSSVLEKNLGAKSLMPTPASEVGIVGFKDSNKYAKDNLVANGTCDNQEEKQSARRMDSSEQNYETEGVHIPFLDGSERRMIPSSSVDVSDSSVVNPSRKTSNLSEARKGQNNGEATNVDAEKVTAHNIVTPADQDHSPSLLEKLFGSALTVNAVGSSSFIEHHDGKAVDSLSSEPFQSSKFAHWFFEEEKTPVDVLSSGKPRDLLSLFVSSEKGGSQVSGVSDEKTTEHIPPNFPLESNELTHMFMTSTATSATVGISEPLYHCNRPDATPGVLTCEDLEQSFLSEIHGNSSSQQHSLQSWNVTDAKAQRPKADVDDHASQHLLSLLKKGSSLKDPAPLPNLDVGHVYGVGSLSPVGHSSSEGNAEIVQNSEKTLTLETLFGTAFMKELHSFEAPISVQRGSIGGSTSTDVSEPHRLPLPVADDGLFPSTVGEYGTNKTSNEDNYLASKINSDKIDEHWLGYDDSQTKIGSKLNTVGGFQDGADGAMEIRLPEEDSLITMGDPVNPQNSMFLPSLNATKAELFSSSKADIAEKLAAMNVVFKDERSMVPGLEGPPFLRGHDSAESEIPYRNLHGWPSPQFHHPQMNHGRPLFHSLEPHHTQVNTQINFMGPESIIHHDPSPHHHFPANMFRLPPFQRAPTGPTRFDPPTHHAVLPQMHMPGSFLPPHPLQGLPRGSSLAPHAFNQMAGYIPETNPMQGFPLNHQQPNYGGPGTSMPAPGVGGGGESNHPNALEQLIEMELRANSKQINPIAAASHRLGTYNHKLDMGFRHQ